MTVNGDQMRREPSMIPFDAEIPPLGVNLPLNMLH